MRVHSICITAWFDVCWKTVRDSCLGCHATCNVCNSRFQRAVSPYKHYIVVSYLRLVCHKVTLLICLQACLCLFVQKRLSANLPSDSAC